GAASVPRLLVSVRDVAEARAAAAGGADIIDFKDPARGPLRQANFHLIAEAAAALRDDDRLPPLSAALGEVREVDDWLAVCQQNLPDDVVWLKLGLSRLGRSAHWVDEWLEARSAIQHRLKHPARWV